MIDEKPERKSQGVGKSSLKRRPNPDPSVAATGASERTRPSICYVPCKSCWLVAGVTYKFAKALPNSIVEHDCNDCRILQGIRVTFHQKLLVPLDSSRNLHGLGVTKLFEIQSPLVEIRSIWSEGSSASCQPLYAFGGEPLIPSSGGGASLAAPRPGPARRWGTAFLQGVPLSGQVRAAGRLT